MWGVNAQLAFRFILSKMVLPCFLLSGAPEERDYESFFPSICLSPKSTALVTCHIVNVFTVKGSWRNIKLGSDSGKEYLSSLQHRV